MSTDLKSESQFLIDLAVSTFNSQFGRNISPAGCEIKSILPDYGTSYGYEISTKITTDYLRLRIYLTLETMDRLFPYRLETTSEKNVEALGDEVYVALGVVNQFYLNEGIYRFRWIGELPSDEVGLSFVANGDFTLMSGDRLILVNQGE